MYVCIGESPQQQCCNKCTPTHHSSCNDHLPPSLLFTSAPLPLSALPPLLRTGLISFPQCLRMSHRYRTLFRNLGFPLFHDCLTGYCVTAARK